MFRKNTFLVFGSNNGTNKYYILEFFLSLFQALTLL